MQPANINPTAQQLPAQLPIEPIDHPVNAHITVPGSKSITNRALVMAALAAGKSSLENALYSDDSYWCAACLRQLGIEVNENQDAEQFTVIGLKGTLPASEATCFVGNSGTTARFLTALATLGQGEYQFDGVARMRQRPIRELLVALRSLGAAIDADADRFPLTIHAQGLRGGETSIDATDSSQLLSGLLMVAPYAQQEVVINVTGNVVSQPYIDITLKMMAQFGVEARNEGDTYRRYVIPNGQHYRAQHYIVEPDASNATYFFAAAAVTGGRVRVPNLNAESLQGDAHFVDVLEEMGCAVTRGTDFLEVQGPQKLRGIDVNLNAMSDTAQTLACIAPFASEPVKIRGIGHNRLKETDRIAAVITELGKLGVQAEDTSDSMTIYPATTLHGAEIDTYEDHRMAMAFSVIGLVVPGVKINDPACTAKTFPDFFARFQQLYR